MFVQDELLRSCLSLSHAASVAITTGFPTHYQHRYINTWQTGNYTLSATQLCVVKESSGG